MIKIGLTGGIATGKSTVARILKEKGIPVIDSDKIAREVVEPEMEGYNKIVEAFGSNILKEDGSIDRKRLGEIVFRSPESKERLEEILHPLITKRIQERVEELHQKGCSIVAIEVPLLFEKGLHKNMDYTILVYAPESVQLERLKKRDNLTEEEALARIKSQMPIEEKRQLADFVVDNTGSLEETRRQIEEILGKIKDGV